MSNMIGMTATNNFPGQYWIHTNKQFRCHCDGYSELPYVDAKYEELLKLKGISCRIAIRADIGEVCEYWNPELFEETDLTLPLYAIMPNGSLHYCQKSYTGKVTSIETYMAAKKLDSRIHSIILEYKSLLYELQLYHFLKEHLADDSAKMFKRSTLAGITSYEIEMNNDHFSILPVIACGSISNWVAVFNMNKIVPNSYIKLEVPEHMVGWVLGKKCENIKAWAKRIGVKKIQIVSKSEWSD